MEIFDVVKTDILNKISTLFDKYKGDNEKTMYLCNILMNAEKILSSKATYYEILKILHDFPFEIESEKKKITKFENVKTDIFNKASSLSNEYKGDNEKTMYLCNILMNAEKMLSSQTTYYEILKDIA